MENQTLNAEVRNTDGKISEIRANKKLPAVVYGKNQEAISIELNYSEFLKTFRKTGESQIINLKINKDELEVLVHDIQKAPVSGDFLHIDFYAITRGEILTTHIHLNFLGDAIAVKEGAIIEEHMKEIEVKCLPRDLVEGFDVDISSLKEIWDSIKLEDIGIDTEKYELLTHMDSIVISANKPKVEVIEDDAPEDPVTGADEVEGEDEESPTEEKTET